MVHLSFNHLTFNVSLWPGIVVDNCIYAMGHYSLHSGRHECRPPASNRREIVVINMETPKMFWACSRMGTERNCALVTTCINCMEYWSMHQFSLADVTLSAAVILKLATFPRSNHHRLSACTVNTYWHVSDMICPINNTAFSPITMTIQSPFNFHDDNKMVWRLKLPPLMISWHSLRQKQYFCYD